jgi:hypothetical protein
MKIIYKYPLTEIKTTLIVPHRAQMLTVDYDANDQLSVWFLHNPIEDFKKKFEFLTIATGQEITEPLNNYDTDHEGFDYYKTVVDKPFIWHIFTREIYE